MTRISSMKAGAIAVFAGSLAACATPTYPVKAGYTPPPPIQPRYSDRLQPAPAAPPPASSAETAPAPAPTPVPAPSAPAPAVESQP
ncbi:MAG: hypothetical protein ACR2F8_01510, partial [Caulobacteraceae bacterium]